MSEEMKAEYDVGIDLAMAALLGKIVEHPDDTTDVGEVWFWQHPKDGVLRGEPYKVGAMTFWDHQWYRWRPSASVADAWVIVDSRATWSPYPPWFELAQRPKGYVCNFVGDVIHNAYGETAALSICLAALAAVKDKE